jgi:hypothetical protein
VNVLQLIQAGCYEANFQTAPSTLLSVTSASDLQALNIFYSLCRELRARRNWPQLKKKWTFSLVINQQTYQLPQDFYAYLPFTGWDVNNRWQLMGPMADSEFNYRIYGWITTENRTAYRIFGPESNPNDTVAGQFYVNPTPGTASHGRFIAFEYITKSYLLPPAWVPNTAYSASQYVTVSGQIYKCTTPGTSAAVGVVPPNMANGTGRDGGVNWTYLVAPAWAGLTYYNFGDYVTNGGLFYRCTAGGRSDVAGGPTGTGTSITDATVTWTNITTTAWAGETSYATNSYVTYLGNLYINNTYSNYQQSTTTSQQTGKLAPAWTNTVVGDGTVVWTWVGTPYETVISNSDVCLFDDDLIIEGFRWKRLQAQGLEYQDIKAEWDRKVDKHIGRWMPARRLSMGDGGVALAGLNPRIPEGNFGNV